MVEIIATVSQKEQIEESRLRRISFNKTVDALERTWRSTLSSFLGLGNRRLIRSIWPA